MDDLKIIELYWSRDERAITETDRAYGPFCHRIAMNILGIREDAEECVSDSYLAVWNHIPPTKPRSLKVFLGRIVRNISLSLYRKNHAQKRYDGITLLLSELGDCIPSEDSVDRHLEREELAALLSHWLEQLSPDDRTLFIRRYWFSDSVKSLAKQLRTTENALSLRLHRLRVQLRDHLEGVAL